MWKAVLEFVLRARSAAEGRECPPSNLVLRARAVPLQGRKALAFGPCGARHMSSTRAPSHLARLTALAAVADNDNVRLDIQKHASEACTVVY